LYYSVRVIGYNASRHAVTDAAIQRIYANTRVSPDIIPHFALNEKQKTYLKCVVNIRASEFVTDGQRWFDIKRMHLPVTHTVFKGEPFTLTPDDPRRVIPLPQDAGNIPFRPENNLVPSAQQITVTPIVIE
jgi:hypothetical protein